MADASDPTARRSDAHVATPVAGRGRGEPVCPFLGLPDDPPTRFSFPSEDHRCWAAARPRTIDLPHQGAFCLAAAHFECPRYLEAPPATQPGTTGIVAGDVGWRVGTGESRGSRHRARSIAAILLVALLLALAVLIAGPALLDLARGSQPAGSAGGSALPVTTTPPSRTASPTPAPTPAPTPMGPGTPGPTAATPAPDGTPRPVTRPRIHVVARGETLTSIAERYGVTVAAIRRVNRLDDPSLIYAGQRLVIPRR